MNWIIRKLRRVNERLQTAICLKLEMLRSELERMDREQGQGCEYCRPDDCCSPLSWQYGLDHIFPDYRFCPMCGRDLRRKEDGGCEHDAG